LLVTHIVAEMRVLTTGGAGYIGSHPAERHLERNDEVTVLDDLSTGRIGNIRKIRRHSSFLLKVGSVTDEKSILDAVQGCDLQYLLAEAAGVRRVVEDPIDTVNATSSERCV